MKKTAILFAIIITTLVITCSCSAKASSDTYTPSSAELALQDNYDVVGVVLENHKNAPISDLSEVKDIINGVCYKRGRVLLTETGGEPYIAYDESLPKEKSGVSKVSQKRNSEAFASELTSYAQSLKPQAPENDVLKALSLTIRKMSTYGGKKALILDGPGIFTSGVIDMSYVMTNETDTVIDKLADINTIPQASGDFTVICTGLGESSGEQKQPNDNDYRKLEDFYRAYFNASGIDEVIFIPSGVYTEWDDSDYPDVSVYEFPNTSILSEEDVEFKKNSTEFVDYDKSLSAIESIACNYNVGDEVLVVGFASSEGDSQDNIKLSSERAKVVGKILESKGLKVSTAGRGYDKDYCIVDTVDGVLNTEKASKNRKVLIMNIDSTEAQALL